MKKLILFLLLSNLSFGQQTWSAFTNLPANTNNQRYDDVFFLNENVGWALNGYFSSLNKTTDGGITWTTQIASGSLGGFQYFRNVEFLNENVGFIGTLSSVFYKTIDGGVTWNPVTNINPNPAAICGLDAVGTSTIYGCGAYFSPAFVIKSTDSGTTWQHLNMSAYATALVEVLFINENLGYASGSNSNGAVILKTENGGTTWSTIYNGIIPGEYVWKLQILPNTNNHVIFGSVSSVAPNSGKIIKSTNAGSTWSAKNVPDVDIQAVGFLTENHGWFGGHATGFYETFDGGTTWTNTNVGSNLNKIFFVNDNVAYASGTTVYKMSNTLATTDFQEHSRENLKVVISPNPIVDKLQVEIEFKSSDNLILGLYSVDGKLIKQLTKDLISSEGKKNYSFDFPYPKGTYILNLHSNTGRQSHKFLK
jgi:photosystem II stability/assembly factor-like uncharacterized protein